MRFSTAIKKQKTEKARWNEETPRHSLTRKEEQSGVRMGTRKARENRNREVIRL